MTFERRGLVILIATCLVLAGILVWSGLALKGWEDRDYAAGLPKPSRSAATSAATASPL